ncbi:MAG: heat-inducible transcription repressor HrcA [Dehalococcoidia bacterium]|nr:MAG: heat-inducible transcription repressor HrcA [Dehalococcoidia bacterium]
MAELPERTGTILKIIVGEYVASVTPVASESVTRGYSLGISPATTRHEMARLEEEGYIARPHTSAGAVPSDKGYRYCVECLLKEARLGQEEQLAIQHFFSQAEQQPESWARLAVTVLTQRLKSIALATPPRAPVCHFRHLDLVALQELLILLVLVLQEGKIKQQLFASEQVVPQDELTTLANKLNATYQGLTYTQIGAQELALSPLEERIIGTIVQVMEAEDKQQYEQFYLDGWRYLVRQAEFVKGRKMLDLVEALEEGGILNNLLGSLGSESGIKVTIGNENEEEALQECSVILSNYGAQGRRGAIGIIGPTRMPYSRAIPTIDYVSAVMSELVSRTYA